MSERIAASAPAVPPEKGGPLPGAGLVGGSLQRAGMEGVSDEIKAYFQAGEESGAVLAAFKRKSDGP